MDCVGFPAYQTHFEPLPGYAEFCLRVKICLDTESEAPKSGLVPRENDTIEHSSIGRSGLERLALAVPQMPSGGTRIELELYRDCIQRYLAVVVLVDHECQGDLDLTPLDSKRLSRALTGKIVPRFGGYRSTAKVDIGNYNFVSQSLAYD